MLEELPAVFVDRRGRAVREAEEEKTRLYEHIGRLKVALEWLEKDFSTCSELRRVWIEWKHPELSVKRQCELLAVVRSSVYYQAAGESPGNVALMRLLDE